MTEARYVATHVRNGQHGVRESAQLVIGDRLCRVQLVEGLGTDQVRLLNSPLLGAPPRGARRADVGDLLRVEGAAGLFRVIRAGAGLILEPVAGD